MCSPYFISANRRRRNHFSLNAALFILAIGLFPLIAQAQYGGGTGEPNDPYLIYTAEQMNTIGTEPNDWDKHFKLMADIDLGNYTGTDFNIIGTDWATTFTGFFDGNGHQILNFTYTSTKNIVGLFGMAMRGAVIMNLGLINPHVEGNFSVGALIGYTDDTDVHHCYVKGGSVAGSSYVGGLIGTNGGSITCCYTWTQVCGKSYVGGIAGSSLARIVNSYSHSDVSGERIVGGLVGEFEGGIINCYACGSVSGQMDTGGLAGIGHGALGGILPYGAFFSFWDIQATGQASSADGEGKTTAQMKAAHTFIPWSCEGLWTIDEGKDYPHLSWEQASGQTIYAELSDYLAGTGAVSDPYQIYTAEELNIIGLFPCEWDKHFKLMADIDMSSYTESAFNIIGFEIYYLPYEVASYIVADGEAFTGTFDGNNKKIYHFSCSGARRAGLFGVVARPALIQNLTMVDPNVSSKGRSAGALVGAGLGSGATVKRCRAENAIVTATNGLAGGLVAGNGGNILECSFTGHVLGHSYVGGLVGDSAGTMERCFSIAQVSGGSKVGGLVGRFRSAVDGRFYIRYCYSLGNVAGTNQVGGLIGLHEGLRVVVPVAPSVFSCYSAAVVTGIDKVGGLIGEQLYDTVSEDASLYWDIQASTQPVSAVGIGKTTAEMQTADTFLEAGWDFLGEIENGLHEIWQMPEGGGYPVLSVLNGYTPPQLQGQGTSQDPYLISDALELGAMVYYSPRAHYRLANSIDLSGIYWGTAVIPRFEGTFDGNGYTISHLTITGNDCLGLFGQLVWAEVRDLGVVDVNITGSGDFVGGLAGFKKGDVIHCYSTGAVNGRNYVGGLLGSSEGTVKQCYSTASVSGSMAFVGGFVGWNNGAVIDCYSTGSVSGKEDVGGLVGKNWKLGMVKQCYSIGRVEGNNNIGGLIGLNEGTITDSFWDIDTSGQSESAGGVGKTTIEMLQKSTFENWDFIEIWDIIENQTYPFLRQCTTGNLNGDCKVDFADFQIMALHWLEQY